VRSDSEAVNRWLTATVVLVGLCLFALPLAFDRLQERPEQVRVRFLDRWTGTLQRDTFPDPDLMNGLVLAVGAGLAAMTALLVAHGLIGNAKLQLFFVVSAVFLAALAVEETFELSETFAVAVGVGPKRTDLMLPVLGLAFVLAFRRLLTKSRRAVWLGACGAALFLGTVFADSLPGDRNIEDPLESLASLLLMTAFAVLTLELVGGRREEAVA
jgi:hypothetical protein